MTGSRGVKKYLRGVSRRLYCSKTTKADLMQGLRDEAEEYSLNSYDALCQRFGTPSEAANEMMVSIDAGEIKRQKYIRRFAATGLLAALVLVIGVLGAFTADAWSKFYQEGTTVTVTDENGIKVIDKQELPDGTADNLQKEGRLQ